MFKKKEASVMEPETTDAPKEHDSLKEPAPFVQKQKNAIVKGSKLSGDISITYDLELDGDVEGNITSEEKSNIIIKGNCNGNIKTREGNVDVVGHMSNGDIIAGGDIKITGTFRGGKIEAKGRIYVDGEFNGRMEGSEIEIGSRAHGTGELLYKECVSISRGADVAVNISKLAGPVKIKNKPADTKVVNMERPDQEKKR